MWIGEVVVSILEKYNLLQSTLNHEISHLSQMNEIFIPIFVVAVRALAQI